MTLQQLAYVVALAQTRHFRRAAERCFVSQSALSIQIKKLEDYLGVALFDRTLRRVQPTAAGRRILPYARVILEEAEFIKQIAREATDPLSDQITLGVIHTLGPYYLPHALSVLRKAFPKLSFSLREDKTANLLDGLRYGDVDAALLALPTALPKSGNLQTETLFQEPFFAAVPEGHRLTKKKTVKPADLTKETMMLLDEGHCLSDQVLEFCGPSYRRLQSVRATSLETLRQLVAMNMGVTVLPHLATNVVLPEKLGGVKIMPFASPKVCRTIAMVWRKDSPPEKTIRLISEALRKHLPAGVRRGSSAPSAKVSDKPRGKS